MSDKKMILEFVTKAKDINNAYGNALKIIEEICDNNERLREALKQIAAFEPLTFAECTDAERIIDIAKQALEDK